jgi:hypothetical protein
LFGSKKKLVRRLFWCGMRGLEGYEAYLEREDVGETFVREREAEYAEAVGRGNYSRVLIDDAEEQSGRAGGKVVEARAVEEN